MWEETGTPFVYSQQWRKVSLLITLNTERLSVFWIKRVTFSRQIIRMAGFVHQQQHVCRQIRVVQLHR